MPLLFGKKKIHYRYAAGRKTSWRKVRVSSYFQSCLFTWCHRCASNKKKDTIENMRKIAKERNGACLSKTYVDHATKIFWKCRVGHKWMATPMSIKKGNWCRICGISKHKRTLNEVKSAAEKKGGRCLSKEYTNNHGYLKFRCAEAPLS